LDRITAISISSLLEKYRAMFSAFVPLPEANMAILVIKISVSLAQKIKKCA
jgi:hypothetical protein